MLDKNTYIKRRQKLKELVKQGIILLLGNTPLPFNYNNNSFPFRQDSTLLYYTGIDIPDVAVIIDTETGEETLFGNNTPLCNIIWTGETPTMQQIAYNSGIDNWLTTDNLKNLIQNAVKQKRKIHYITPYQAEIKIFLANLIDIDINKIPNNQSLQLINAAAQMRKTKDLEEIAEIKKAVGITRRMHEYVISLCKEKGSSLTERQISGEIYRYAAGEGYYNSFAPIVTVHGEIFHNQPSDSPLQQGRLLLVDAGVETTNHYAGDMTRTTPVSGQMTTMQQEIYDIVKNAQDFVKKTAAPGILWRDMHNIAASKIVDGLKSIGLMRGNSDDIVECGAYAMFFPHGLGHLLGLDVHDMENYGENNFGYNSNIVRSQQFGPCYLRYGLKLEQGMTITDEPGIYFIPQLIDQWRAEKKFDNFINYKLLEKYRNFGGIRIEDDLLITPNGCEVL